MNKYLPNFCFVFLLLWLLANTSLQAQHKNIVFTTEEGTWIALDVSPDGQTIIFELLGDIYAMPITGGKAKPLLSGNAFQSQARFSPDGQHITFISDESGADNVWIAKKDGTQPQQVTKRTRELMLSPEWSKDEETILVTIIQDGLSRKADLYSVNLKTGQENLLVANANGPSPRLISTPAPGPYMSSVHPNGKDIYFTSVTPRAYGQRKGASSQVLFFDSKTGKTQAFALDKGNAMKPLFSSDGQWLAYAAMSAGKTGLRIRNMASGEEKWLVYPYLYNELEARATRDVVPNYAFSRDGKFVIAAYGGKIHQIDIESGTDKVIPFSAEVMMELPSPLNFPHKIGEGSVQARFIQQPAQSQKGDLAFSVWGKIYLKKQGNSAFRKISNEQDWTYFPCWSPDGTFLVYCTWNEEGGHVWKYTPGTVQPLQRITETAAFYATPAISPDNQRILLMRTTSWIKRKTSYRALPEEGEFIEIDLSTRKISVLGSSNGFLYPQYDKEGKGFFACSAFQGINYQNDIGSSKIIAKSAITAKEIKINPGGTALLFTSLGGTLHQVDLPSDTAWAQRKMPIAFNPFKDGKLLDGERPEDFAWSAKGIAPLWTKGARIFYQLGEKTHQENISITRHRAIPKGLILLQGATCLSMNGNEIIKQSEILIRDNRIVAVGATGTIFIPSRTEIIDVSGKYLMPGIIDVHAHFFIKPGVLEAISPAMYANLAYGTTTIRDPQSNPEIFTYSELVEAGLVDGPRIFSTGPGLFLWDQLDSYEKTKARLEIYKNRYKTNYIKSYLVGNRQQRHWMIQACKALQLMPIAEGGADAKQDITHALDGFNSNEHSLPNAKIYKDVVELFAQSGINYTPTLLVAFGGPLPIYQYLAKENPFENEKLRKFFPKDELYDKSATRLLYFRDADYHVRQVAEGVNKIFQAGGNVAVGGHGEMQGLQNHWEMWLMASGGMKNHDVLKAATINGAKALGLDAELGSIEKGKLADLIILDDNPLTNIRNTTSIKYVMKNGVLYDGETLEKLHPVKEPVAKPWWQMEENN